MPVSFTATRTTSFRPLTGDQDGDGFADAGDVLRHILTIHNTGNTDATAVVLNDLLGGSTETGLMNISPIAFNDAFTAVGNTALRVGGAANIGTGPSSIVAGNLLANDVGSTTVGVGALAADDVTGFTIDTVTNQLTAGGGRFSIFADGSFNYISEAGDQGTDSFTYTIRDAGIDGVAGNGDDTTSTATVTITLTGQVWYVDSAAAGGGTGTSANPFNSITALNTANVDGANDYIYVKGNATGPLVLETGEHLIGQGADLDVAGFHLADDGARSTITNNAAGFAVTLAGGGTGNNEIAGINIVSTGGAGNHGLTGTSFGNLTLNNTTIDASGQALVLSTGGIVAGSTGLVSTDSDGGTNNVSLTTVSGTLALGTGALSGATGTAFNVSGGSVTATYSGNVSQASASQALVNVTGGHTGTLTFSTGTLSATNGTGLQFDNADGNYNFNGTNTLNGGDAGVDIVNGSGGNFSFSTNSAITNATGIAFNVNGGAGNIDYNGTISHTANTRAISVQNHLGGTVSFDGTVSATGSSDGILLATNTGAIINFTNQLTINAAGANFDASGGGTVTATGSGNVINSGTATALSVANTFIGLGGLNFVSISSSGAANGIVLNNTGTTAGVHGGLTVTGDGGSAVNASGGIISGTTGSGAGISIMNARDIVIDQMTIQNGTGDGILGSTIVNFSLSNSTVNNNGDALQEHGADLTQVTGNVTFNNVSFTNNETSQVRLINTSGTANVSVINSDFSSTGLAAAPNGLHGFHMETQGSAAADLMITGTDFNNLFSNSIHTTNEGSGVFEITIATSTFNNVGAGAINIVQNSSGTVRFYVHDNGTFLRGTNTGSSHSININQAGGVPAGAVMEGAISNNVIGNISSSNSANTGGDGIRVLSVGSGTTNVRIDNNNIQGTGANGINVQMSEDTNAAHTMNATIFNNVVSLSHVNNFDGIRVVAGSLVNDAGILRLDMHDNNAGTVAAGNDFTVRQRFATTVQLLNYAGAATDVAAVQTYLDVTRANNPTGAGNDWFITTQAPGGGFLNTASVPAPTLPTPMLAVSTPPEQAPQEHAPKSSGDGTGGGFITPVGGEPAPAPGQPKVVDDGILSQAELTLIVNAAIDRWAAAGATADQIAAMRAVTFSVENMSGLYLGSSSAGHITLDSNAAGFSWFVDETPGEDSEYNGTGTQLVAPGNTQAGVRMDLLTTVMHELGHQIGLADIYNGDHRDELMYGMANPGERRLPGNDDLTGASGAPVTGIAFILSPINIGTIPAGQIVVVQWDSTVNGYTNQLVPTFTNFSTLSGGNFVNTNSNSETMGPGGANNIILDSLTLGNQIFFDVNNSGTFDAGDSGINGVALTLFADTNANGVFDSGIDVQLGTTTSAGGGLYSFANLAPGNYIVRVDAANFTGGGALVGRITATGASDPDDNIDNDDNGANAAGGIVVSQAITLSHDNEPTPGAGNDTNNTLDFGFIQLNQAPVNTVPGAQGINEDASRVFSAGNGNAISVADVDVAAGNLTVTLTVAHGTLTLSGTAGLSFGAGDGSGDATMTFTGTPAAINSALNGLTYTPTGDFNGADTLTVTTNDNGNTGVDPGLTGGANDEQDSDPITINIAAINDAPVVVGGGTESATTINEDTPGAGQTIQVLFASEYSDAADNQVPNGGASSPGQFSGIAVTANGSSGATGQWQYFSGGVWTDIGTVSDAAAKLLGDPFVTLIRFNPALNFNGPAPTLTVHLIDNSLGFGIVNGQVVNISGVGATGGTTAYSTGTVVLSQDVTAVNDAPTQSNLHGDSATWTEDGGAVGLDVGGNASILDIDSADFDGGTLTVTITGGVVAEDGIFIRTMGLITFDATTVSYNGNQIATYLGGGFGGGNIVFTFDADATPTAVTALVQSLAYDNSGNSTGEYPTGSTRSVTWTLVDGDGVANAGTDTLLIGTQVAIVPLNDAPVVTVASPLAVDEQVAEAIAPAGTLLDADLDARNSGNGDYAGATLTIVRNGGAAAQDLLAIVNGAGFTVNGSNLEAGGLVFATFAGGNGSALVITFTSSGTAATSALADAVLQAVQYTFTGDSPPPSIQLDVTMNDGAPANAGQGSVAGNPAATTSSITVNITDTAENAAPVVDLNTGTGGIDDTGLFVEGSVGGAAIGTAIGVTDGDGDPILSATIIITDPETGDLLFANLPLPGGIVIDGASTATMLILTGSASAATYATALGQVGFTSSSDDPTDGGTNPNRVITVTATDAFGTGAAATMTLAIAGVNDEPTLIATGLDPTFPENTAAVDLYSGVTASTVEGGQTITSMTLTVTNVNDGANEILNFDGSTVALTNGNSVVGTATNGLTVNVTVVGSTATVTFTGATLSAAALQTLVDALTYVNTAIPPTDGDRVITITQLVDSGSNTGDNDNVSAPNIASTVDVEPNNQAPAVDLDNVAGGVNHSASFIEDGAGVAIGSGVAVTDPNFGSGDMIESATITLTDRVAGDALTVTGALPPGVNAVTTPTAGAITIQITGPGTGAQYQALIESIQYSTTSHDPTVGGTDLARTITVTVNDGTINSAVATTTVAITASDDPPVALPDAFTITEAGMIVGGNVFANNGSGLDSDPDGPPLAVSAVGGGTLGVQFTLPSGALLTMNANGTFDYDPNGAFDETPTLGSGASNTPAPDSFTYTLAGGNTTMVSISISGLDTNDLLLGTAGSDTLMAGIGNDSLDGGAGADAMFGGTGNDTYFIDNGGDSVTEAVGEGADIAYTTGSYALAAGSEVEILSALDNGGAGAMNLYGNEFGNQLWGNNGVNFLAGGGGADVLIGFGSGDLLVGGAAGDYLDGGGAGDALYGSEGDDTLIGGAGNDYLDGGAGADGIYGGTGDDVYFFDSAGDYAVEAAGEGHDVVYTMVSYSLNPGSEVELLSALDNSSLAAINLHGNEFANQIWGTNGANFLSGGGGNDELIGFAGNDLLIGGGGNDYMDGGAGADTFAFVAALGLGNVDTIANYSGAGTDGEDIIALDDAVFAGLGTGPLAANAFTVGTAATTVDHRIIYDSITGALYFDADGSGAGLAVQFATLQDAPPLTAGDFVVI